MCHDLQAEHGARSERKRRDSFGMFDGYDSCSEDSSSSSSSEESDEEVPALPANLPIIKTNGQVYTYPDGKAGMGQSPSHTLTPCPPVCVFVWSSKCSSGMIVGRVKINL